MMMTEGAEESQAITTRNNIRRKLCNDPLRMPAQWHQLSVAEFHDRLSGSKVAAIHIDCHRRIVDRCMGDDRGGPVVFGENSRRGNRQRRQHHNESYPFIANYTHSHLSFLVLNPFFWTAQ
jgi:hypothetical protein